MTEANHPLEDEAHALIEDSRFCEFLDAHHALSSGWPHSRYSSRRWLLNQCGIDSLGYLAIDPEAATAFDQIARRFAEWDHAEGMDV